jgi:phosphonate transport system ATP-binding protein
VKTAAGDVCPDKPLLSLRGVALGAPAATAAVLTDIDLDIGSGERVALVGPSGSGKTTLLRTIAGQIPARSGTILFAGEPLPTPSRGRTRIALVSQRHDLIEPLRVDKNVMAGALGRWSSWRALRFLFWSRPNELAEAERALADVGLATMLRRRTASLSGGEQQRVAIARALVQAPTLLLADEPIASLDPATACEVMELLVRLSRSHGMTLVCALHQPDLARRFCDRVFEVGGGTVREQAATPLPQHGG